ncbi:MAG: hypothetical protein F6K22_36720 [Okeania sp. SIO2F4]|uniref:hypothetical protein n=1 Tax=Okeania sp. SIO2F4 TaxID=2607790 RepID=UPI00142A55F3|nr:hypothetical protein [Okeania sp. SIO2F4]NES07848.1 hypothetical protein [Okeania sp. SIO2F4]
MNFLSLKGLGVWRPNLPEKFQTLWWAWKHNFFLKNWQLFPKPPLELIFTNKYRQLLATQINY